MTELSRLTLLSLSMIGVGLHSFLVVKGRKSGFHHRAQKEGFT